MNNSMTRFQRFLLRRICRFLVRQGWHHKRNIIEYYSIMREAVLQEFTEDNKATHEDFMTECHNLALAKPYDGWKGIPSGRTISLPRAEPHDSDLDVTMGEC